MGSSNKFFNRHCSQFFGLILYTAGIFIFSFLVFFSGAPVFSAGPKMANITQTRPDKIQIFFTEKISSQSISNRNNFNISGSASIVSSTGVSGDQTGSNTIELYIKGLLSDTLYTLYAASMTAVTGQTTEPGELSFKTPPSIANSLTWQKPNTVTPVAGGYICSAAVTGTNNLIITSYKKSGISEISDIKIFTKNESADTFGEQTLSENNKSAHISSYDGSWPDMGKVPLINPGTNIASLDNIIGVVWSGINYQQGKLYAAFSNDSALTFEENSMISWTAGLNIAALTPAIAMEPNLNQGENLIFTAFIKTVYDTDINQNTITKSRDLVILRIAGPLSSKDIYGKYYSIMSEKTVFSGSPLIGYPANPVVLLKNHSLHICFTLFNESSKYCGIRYGRFDFDHARGSLESAVDFKDISPYSSLSSGPVLAWQNNNLTLAYITLDQFMKSELVSRYSSNGGLSFSDSKPITSLMLDFTPWIQKPVFNNVFSLYSNKNSSEPAGSAQNSSALSLYDKTVSLLVKDLRIDENMNTRTLHRLLVISSYDSGLSWKNIESPGKPDDNTFFEYASRPGSIIETRTGTGVVYTSTDTFAEGSSQGFSRIFYRNRDFTPPSLISARAENAFKIVLTFDEPIDAAEAVKTGNFSFENMDNQVYSALLSDDQKEIIINCSELTGGQIVTIKCTSLRDLAGNPISASKSFHTFTVPLSSSPVSGWIAPQRISYEAGDSLSPQVEIFNDSALIVWADYRDNNTFTSRPNSELYSRFSPNKGRSWENESRLTNHIEYSLAPDLWSSSAGFTLAWQDFRDKNFEIYTAGCEPAGSWVQESRLTRDFGNSADPKIVRIENTIYSVWADNRDGDNDIYIIYSDNGGITWSSEIAISDNSSESEKPSIAPGKDKRIYIVWQDDQNLIKSILFKKWTHNDSETGSTHVISGSLPAKNPSIACDSDENILICWAAEIAAGTEQLYFVYSTDRGVNFSAPKAYSDHAGKISGLSMASSGKTIYTAFSDDRNGFFDVFLKYTTSAGAQASSSINLSSGSINSIKSNSINPDVSAWGDLAAVVYEDDMFGDKEIMFTINSNIIPGGPEFTIASFINPADRKSMYVLAKSSLDLDSAPHIMMYPPQEDANQKISGITLESTLLKSNIWLARLNTPSDSTGLIRFSVSGKDKYGNTGYGISGSYLSKISASTRGELISPDSVFKYSVLNNSQNLDFNLMSHTEDIPANSLINDFSSGNSTSFVKKISAANKNSSVDSIDTVSFISEKISSDIQKTDELILISKKMPFYKISADSLETIVPDNKIDSNKINSRSISLTISLNKSADKKEYELEKIILAQKNRFNNSLNNFSINELKNKSGLFKFNSASDATPCFLGSYNDLIKGISIIPEEKYFLALDTRGPQIENVALSIDNKTVILKADIVDNGSGINENSFKIECFGKIDTISYKGSTLTAFIKYLNDSEITISAGDMLNNISLKKVDSSALTTGLGIKSFISWPNPTANSATLRIDSDILLDKDFMEVKIYDTTGEKLITIPGDDFISTAFGIGFSRYEYTWNLTNESGIKVSNGTYIARLIYTKSPEKEMIFKITILK
jgi:hypothetical protein